MFLTAFPHELAGSNCMGGKIYIGSDHGGVNLKDQLVAMLTRDEYDVEDFGTTGTTPIDYPIIAAKVAQSVAKDPKSRGIIVCGSGIGVCISANKVSGIRCALVHDAYTARMSRQHNNANMIAIGERVTGSEVAKDAVKVFLSTPFEGGRHAARVGLISQLDQDGHL